MRSDSSSSVIVFSANFFFGGGGGGGQKRCSSNNTQVVHPRKANDSQIGLRLIRRMKHLKKPKIPKFSLNFPSHSYSVLDFRQFQSHSVPEVP